MIRWNSVRTALRISTLKVSNTAGGAPSSACATLTLASHAASASRCTRLIARRTIGCARPSNASERPSPVAQSGRVAREAEYAVPPVNSGQIVEADQPFGRAAAGLACRQRGHRFPRRSHSRRSPAGRCGRPCRRRVPGHRKSRPGEPHRRSTPARRASHDAARNDRSPRTPGRSRAADRDTPPHRLPPIAQSEYELPASLRIAASTFPNSLPSKTRSRLALIIGTLSLVNSSPT